MMRSQGAYDRRCIMTVSVQQIRPVAHVPLGLGVLRRLEVASVIDGLLAPPGTWACWARGRSPGPGHAGWRSCPLQSGQTVGRTWDAGLASARVTRCFAPCLPLRAYPRCPLCRTSHPGVSYRSAQSPGGVGPPDALVAPGYHHDGALWGVGGGPADIGGTAASLRA